MQTIISSIGKNAIEEKSNLIILFDQSATRSIKDVAVIHELQGSEMFDVQAGDSIYFGEQKYKVNHVGSLANSLMNAMGHTNLYFQEERTEGVENAMYLSPCILPHLEKGMILRFERGGLDDK